jgi:hypothetical protein
MTQRFFTGVSVNHNLKAFFEEAQRNRDTNALTEEREKNLQIVGAELGKKHNKDFVGTRRRYPEGAVSRMTVKSAIELGFQVGSPGSAGHKILARLSEGFHLEGKSSTGWVVWLKENELDRITKIFK